MPDLKILYQHRTLGDGAEGIHISEMIGAFEALGHDVVLHALAKSPKQGEAASGLPSRIKRWLPQPLLEMAMLAFNVVDYVGFRRVLRRERPDVVYKRHAVYDVGTVLAARHAGVPLVLEANSAYSSADRQQVDSNSFPGLVRVCERAAVKAATLVVAVSTPLKDLLEGIGADVEHTVVVPNGANPARFDNRTAGSAAIRARYGLGSSMVVGWVGILRKWHRVELLFDALQRVPSLKVMIIGDGPDRPRLEMLVAQGHLEGRVVFTGRIPHDEVPDHLAAVDVAVVSGDRTGFASPMKLLEYMAMGRAVIAPRLRNIEDIVEDGRDGLLFTPRDAVSLAAALTQLADDSVLRARLGRAARLKVEQVRNWRSIATVILRAVSDRVTAHPSEAESSDWAAAQHRRVHGAPIG